MELPVFILGHWMPFILLAVCGCAVLLIDVFASRKTSHVLLPSLCIISCLGAWAWMMMNSSYTEVFKQGEVILLFENYKAFVITGFTRSCIGILLFGSVLILLLSIRVTEKKNLPLGEYYALTMLSIFGLAMMAAAVEFLAIFICLEIASIAIYVLIGIEKHDARAGEASLTYFILGAFASAFLLFGGAFFYGYARTTFFYDAHPEIALQSSGPVIALALIFTGFAFKLALAPFHLYAADVYDGAPTTVAAMLAILVKISGFCVLAQLIMQLNDWYTLGKSVAATLVFLALISIIIGNAVALTQTRIKRLLAYSSIAHSGYLLLGVLVLVDMPSGSQAVIQNALVTYLLAYTLMNAIAFGVVASLGGRFENEIKNYAGLSSKHPFMAGAFALALISMTGLPATIGFVGKFYVFSEVMKTHYVYAVVVAFLFSRIFCLLLSADCSFDVYGIIGFGITWGECVAEQLGIGILYDPDSGFRCASCVIVVHFVRVVR